MNDRGPFQMDDDAGAPEIDRLARELLLACEAMADRQLRGKPVMPAPGLPGASIHERTAHSAAIQAISSAGEGRHIMFNIVDGWAHGIAAVLAQRDQEASLAAQGLLRRNIAGYEARTRASICGKPAGSA